MTNLMSIGDNMEDNGETRVRVSGVYYLVGEQNTVARTVYMIFILYGLSVQFFIFYSVHNMPIVLTIYSSLDRYIISIY